MKSTSGSKGKNAAQTMAVGLDITEKEVPLTWAERNAGAYLLRTNCTDKDPNQLWTWYVQLTQAEECFRISKSDLHLRPVFHQKTERVDAHILVCFLTLAMWRSLEMWMKSKALGNCARQLIKEIATVHMMDVTLPVRDQNELSLRVVSKPDEQVAQLLGEKALIRKKIVTKQAQCRLYQTRNCRTWAKRISFIDVAVMSARALRFYFW